LMNSVCRLRHRCFFAGFCTHTWLSASMEDMMHADDRATVHRCLKLARNLVRHLVAVRGRLFATGLPRDVRRGPLFASLGAPLILAVAWVCSLDPVEHWTGFLPRNARKHGVNDRPRQLPGTAARSLRGGCCGAHLAPQPAAPRHYGTRSFLCAERRSSLQRRPGTSGGSRRPQTQLDRVPTHHARTARNRLDRHRSE
jgi:hypothetical protein